MPFERNATRYARIVATVNADAPGSAADYGRQNHFLAHGVERLKAVPVWPANKKASWYNFDARKGEHGYAADHPRNLELRHSANFGRRSCHSPGMVDAGLRHSQSVPEPDGVRTASSGLGNHYCSIEFAFSANT